jgi:TRAP-type C4-dicarboxylate transport system permease small subunit
MNDSSVHEPKQPKLGPGGWLLIVAMGVILGVAIWFAFYGWNLTDAEMDTAGYLALGFGIVLSMLLGGGLMALVFYSHRKGYDR